MFMITVIAISLLFANQQDKFCSWKQEICSESFETFSNFKTEAENKSPTQAR